MTKKPNILLITSDQQHWDTLGAWSIGTKLSENEQPIGDILQDNDYRTALIGKAHLLLLQYAWAELGKEPLHMPRISDS